MQEVIVFKERERKSKTYYAVPGAISVATAWFEVAKKRKISLAKVREFSWAHGIIVDAEDELHLYFKADKKKFRLEGTECIFFWKA